MTTTTWTGGNGNFNTASNWSNGVPVAGVDAFITGSVGAPLTVSYTAGADTANSLTTTYTTFAMGGGSLTLAAGSSFSQALTSAAALTQSAGLIDFRNGGAANQTTTINGAGQGVVQTGGTLQADAGLLQIYGSSAFAGTLAGAGAIALRGSGIFSFNAGSAVSIATLALDDSATLLLNAALTDSATFTDQQNGTQTTINLNGKLLALRGPAFFSNNFGANDLITGPGTLSLGGVTQLSSTVLGGGAALVNTGTVSQLGFVQLGDSGTSIATLANSGTWEISTGATLGVGAQAASAVTNTGLFEMVGSAGASSVSAQFVNAAGGTIVVAAGDTLQLYGNASDAGAITGAGALALRGASVFTLSNPGAVSIGTLDLYDSATLALAADFSFNGTFNDPSNGNVPVIALDGHTLTLQGAATLTDNFGANDAVTGPGTLALAGATQISGLAIGGGAALTNAGSVSQTGYFQIGDANTDIVSATNTGTWTLGAGATIGTGANSAVSFTNAGLLQMNTNGGTATVTAVLADQTGSIAVAANDLLQLYGNASVGGAISGAGALAIRGGSVFTAGAGFVATIGTIDLADSATLKLGANVAYGGTFNATEGGSVTSIQLSGQTLTLSGAATFTNAFGQNDFVGGPGTLALGGIANIGALVLGGSAVLSNTATVNQTGYLQIGDGSGQIAGVTNAGTWNLSAPVSIGTGANSASTFTNTGLFEMTSTAGPSNIDALFVSGGTLDAVNVGSVINLNDGGTIAGTVTGNGTLNFQNGQTYTLSTKINVSVANLGETGNGTNITDLVSNTGYAGNLTLGAGSVFDIASGVKFTLTGTGSTAGTINGAGTFVVNAATALLTTNGLTLGGSATLLEQKGTLAENQNWTIGDGAGSTAKLSTAATATYEITGDSGIASNGVGAISNGGTFEKLAGTGLSMIAPLITNAGKLIGNSGTLEFLQSVTNDGTAIAENGNSLVFAASLVTAAGHTGTIDLVNGGNASFGGFVDAAQTLTFADGSIAEATIRAPGSFTGTIAGFSGANRIDLQGVSNATASYAGTTTAGTLTLTETIGGNPLVVAQLHFAGDFTLASFRLTADGNGGTLIQTASGAPVRLPPASLEAGLSANAPAADGLFPPHLAA